MRTAPLRIVLSMAALALGGCNLSSPVASVPPPPPQAAQAVVADPPLFAKLPDGAACTGKIRRYQAVLRADLSTGNLERPVYDQIELELGQAAADCIDGLGPQAIALTKASAARHGYHIDGNAQRPSHKAN